MFQMEAYYLKLEANARFQQSGSIISIPCAQGTCILKVHEAGLLLYAKPTGNSHSC